MSSTVSSVRSSPLPDLANESYNSRSLSLRDQTLLRRQLADRQSRLSGSTANTMGGGQLGQHVGGATSNTSTYQRNLVQGQRGAGGGVGGQGGKAEGGPQFQHVTDVLDPSNPHYVVVDGQKYSLVQYSGESMAFWIMLTVLSILAIINFLITVTIFGVLRLGAGMESVEFLPSVLKFYNDIDLGDIFKKDGILQGLPDIPVEMTGDEAALQFTSLSGHQPSLSIDHNIINISQVSEFRIVDKRGRQVFSTNLPTLGLPKGIKSIDVQAVKTNRISSGFDSKLEVRSTTFAYLRGSEGTKLDGKTVEFKADMDIFLKSVQGNIYIQGKNGTYFDVNSLPLVKEDGVTRKQYTYMTLGKRESQYQLCVCMPEGKLYRVQIPMDNLKQRPERRVGCHTVKDPCK